MTLEQKATTRSLLSAENAVVERAIFVTGRPGLHVQYTIPCTRDFEKGSGRGVDAAKPQAGIADAGRLAAARAPGNRSSHGYSTSVPRRIGQLAFGEIGRREMPDLDLVGTWRMVSWQSEDVATGKRVDVFGPDPIGYLSYGADGRMIVLVVSRDRPNPAGAPSTDAEKTALFDSMLSFAGRYRRESGKVVHELDASWNQAWTGSRQERFFAFDGDLLEFSRPPAIDPHTGATVVHRMAFRKMPPAHGE